VSEGWRLLLTRPREECAASAAFLAAHGVYSASLPLLEIEPLAGDALPGALRGYAALIVVSKPAARLVLDLLDDGCAHDTAWFSVGAASAAILAERGLPVVYPADGDDSEALLRLPALQAALRGDQPRVLILRGEGGRELLADTLRARGARVDYLELYRRRLPEYPPGTLVARVAAERLNGLVVSSGQGLEHLRRLAGDAWTGLSRLPLFVPSPRVAELARAAGASHVMDCRGASAEALLATLGPAPERIDT